MQKTTRNTRQVKSLARVSAVVSLCLLLTGCLTSNQPEAPAVHYGMYGGADSAGIHTVAAGDTVWDLAERYKLAMPDIIQINGLQPPYNIDPGQRLKLPPPATYAVKSKDTLYGISQTFSISPNEVARLNNFTPPYNLYVGQNIRLPSSKPPVRLASAKSAPPA